MKKIKVTNLVKFNTLLLLLQGPKHGYELLRELEKKLERRVSPSQIYPFLSLLKKNNFIIIKKEGKRYKKTYALTSEGKKFITNMMDRFGDLIELAIQPKLTACAHCGCKIYKGGHKEKIKNRYLVFCCIHCAHSYMEGHN